MENGISALRDERWNVSVELGNIARSTAEGTFNDQLTNIGAKLFTSFSDAMAQYRGPLLNDPKIAFVFAKRTDGRTYLAYQEFPVITATQGNIVQFSNVRIIINGSEQAVAQVRPCRRAVR